MTRCRAQLRTYHLPDDKQVYYVLSCATVPGENKFTYSGSDVNHLVDIYTNVGKDGEGSINQPGSQISKFPLKKKK